MNFMAVKKLRKHSGFTIFKESVFTPVKTGYVKGEYHLSIEGIRKGYLFCEKWYIKRLGFEPIFLFIQCHEAR